MSLSFLLFWFWFLRVTYLLFRASDIWFFEGLGGARTSLVAYNTMHGTGLKQLPAQASNDDITSVSAAHLGHRVRLFAAAAAGDTVVVLLFGSLILLSVAGVLFL